MKEFGQYPIDDHLQVIGEALQKSSTCLIKAEPGAGKTTAGDPSGMSWHGGYVYHFKGL